MTTRRSQSPKAAAAQLLLTALALCCIARSCANVFHDTPADLAELYAGLVVGLVEDYKCFCVLLTEACMVVGDFLTLLRVPGDGPAGASWGQR